VEDITEGILAMDVIIIKRTMLMPERGAKYVSTSLGVPGINIRRNIKISLFAGSFKNFRREYLSEPMTFKTSGGFTLYVGKNNVQNDRLTMKESAKDDIWFHVKDMPGSHVIMKTDGEEPSETDYTEAAELAAYYSKATAGPVAVDYTRVKNVKKPAGSKPGFVTYKTNYSAVVDPMTDEELGARRVK
jgi:predicted ribosome quality control (RQC) complex YloA/Tae2 family protein